MSWCSVCGAVCGVCVGDSYVRAAGRDLKQELTAFAALPGNKRPRANNKRAREEEEDSDAGASDDPDARLCVFHTLTHYAPRPMCASLLPWLFRARVRMHVWW